MTPHYFSGYVIVIILAVTAFIIGHSTGRELRPSDHGLSYQDESLPPEQNVDEQEMRSFFGATTTSYPLPEAQNISGTWWSVHGDEKSRDGRRDHVRTGLLVASAVCGLTGVVLLVVSGIIFLFRLHKQSPKAERISSTSAITSVPHAVSDK